MSLTRFSGQYEELFKNCILWWQGRDQTITGFPIIPAGVTVTPNGTFANDLNLGTNTIVKTFDGSTNYISLSDNDAWTFGSGDLTICLWAKRNSATTIAIFGQMASDFVTGSIYALFTPILFRIGYFVSNVQTQLDFTTSELSTDWIYICFFRSGSSIKLYYNAVEISTKSISGALDNASQAFRIGVGGDWVDAPMKGNMKDLMIFTRALSQSEIITMMRKTNPVSGMNNFYPALSGIRGVE